MKVMENKEFVLIAIKKNSEMAKNTYNSRNTKKQVLDFQINFLFVSHVLNF